jgi:D-glycero-D-manno-heptose 1,7-bisphosphate phosphatase
MRIDPATTGKAAARPAAVAGFTALVLAGGRGTRLRSAVPDRVKPLAPIGDEPFLARVLDQLAAAGCERAILCTGHGAAAIEREFGADHGGMPLVHSVESRPLGTAGALRLGIEHTAADAVLVVNGDSFCDLDLAGFVRVARALQAPTLVAAAVDDTGRFGRLELAADGRVTAFAEKVAGGAGIINAGIYWLPRGLLEALPLWSHRSLERDVLPTLVPACLRAFVATAPFLDIGVPEDYARAAAFFADCERAAFARRTAAGRRGLLVVDRDGTLIEERHYLADPAGVALLPGTVAGLAAFTAAGYEVAVVTNQSGIGRGFFDAAAMDAVHAELCGQLAAHGIALRGIWHCPHAPADNCACRKPAPGLLQQAMTELGYRPEQCLVVGDKRCDIELGQAMGARTALVRTGYGVGTERDGHCSPDHVVDDLAALALAEVRR